MSVESKYTLKAQNQSSFPNNETGYITPEILREFNIDMIDSLVDELGFNIYSASVASNTNQFSSKLRFYRHGSMSKRLLLEYICHVPLTNQSRIPDVD